MRHTILISFVFIFLTNTLSTQNWTPPINVSNTNGFIIHSDFSIDNEGVIHCVWDFKYNSNYSVICYSYSEDDGFSWSDIINISQNDTNYCSNPQVIHDSENNLYVGYDLNDYNPQNWGSYVCMVGMDSSSWNEPIILSEGISTRLAVDNNNRVYIFWFMGSPFDGEFYYQYFEDTTWSEVFCPFDNDELTSINEIVVDDNNNLHCAGYHDSLGDNNLYAMYLKYECATGNWGEMNDFPGRNQVRDIDIALDTAGLPRICWGKNAAYYSFFDGINWVETDTITQADIRDVELKIDTLNKLHIAITHSYSNSMQLYYYHMSNGVNWENSIVDSADNIIFTPELELHNNNLYLVYDKSDNVPYSDVFLTKLDLITSGNHPQKYLSDIYLHRNFPNPFSEIVNISFILNKQSRIFLYIKDLNGNIVSVLINKSLNKGTYIEQWDGTNISGQKVAGGIYLYFLQTNFEKKEGKIIYIE